MLIAQVQADHKLDVLAVQNFHPLFVATLPIQNERAITQKCS